MIKLTSSLFFVSFVFHVMAAQYVIDSGKLKKVNILAVLFFMLNAVWSFGFSMRATAESYEAALYWSKVASIGWTFIYGVHFLWTYHYLYKKRSKLILLLVVISTSIIFYIFVLSPDSRMYFSIEMTRVGYVDVAGYYNQQHSIGSISLSVYYVTVFLFNFLMMVVQLINSKDDYRKKTLRIILSGTVLTFLFAVLVDQIIKFFWGAKFPSYVTFISIIMEVFMIIVMSRAGYIDNFSDHVKKFKSIDSLENNLWHRVEFFVLFLSLLEFYVVGILFSRLNVFSYNILTSSVLLYSLMKFLRLKIKNDKTKNNVLMAIFSVYLLLVVILSYNLSVYMSWFYPLCFIVIFVLFKKRTYIYVLSAITIILIMWANIFAGDVCIGYNKYELFKKVVIYIVFFSNVLYVNKFFVKRAKYNTKHVKLQEKFAEISASFIDVNRSNMEEKINQMLKLARDYIKDDRLYIVLMEGEQHTFTSYFEEKNPDVISASNSLKVFQPEDLRWLWNYLEYNSTLKFEDIRNVPPEAEKVKLFFSLSGTKSILITRIYEDNKLRGFVVASSLKSLKKFNKDDEDFMAFIAKIIGDTVVRIDSETIINRLAYYSSLTEMPNNIEFNRILDKQMNEYPNKICGLIYFDIDFFQEVNDIVGHEGGDELLRKLVVDMQKKIQAGDVISHHTGDEFYVLLRSDYTKEEIISKVIDIKNILSVPKTIRGHEFFISVSMGVSIYTEDAFSKEELLRNAQLAFYHAKKNGRNQFVLCNQNIKDYYNYLETLQNSIFSAVENGEMYLEYQPEIDVNTEKVKGAEALIRWKHSKFGIVSPEEIIDISEDVGFEYNICKFVISESMRQLSKWQNAGLKINMTINFSQSELFGVDIIEIFSEYIEKFNLDSNYIIVEFSENTGMILENEFLEALHQLGLKVSVDEFGSKNSLLSRIADLSIDRLKIDKGFIERSCMTERDGGIAKSMIEIGKNLDINVTALGVETEEQFEFFKQNGCDEVQGFAFYEPMSAEDITDLLLFEKS